MLGLPPKMRTASACCSTKVITIFDRGLAVTTTNPNPPTLEYKLQEALKLHKVLDELQDLATTTEISPEKRLLLLDDNAIESARSHILARPPQPS